METVNYNDWHKVSITRQFLYCMFELLNNIKKQKRAYLQLLSAVTP